jgi:hypothetical protein
MVLSCKITIAKAAQHLASFVPLHQSVLLVLWDTI